MKHVISGMLVTVLKRIMLLQKWWFIPEELWEIAELWIQLTIATIIPSWIHIFNPHFCLTRGGFRCLNDNLAWALNRVCWLGEERCPVPSSRLPRIKGSNSHWNVKNAAVAKTMKVSAYDRCANLVSVPERTTQAAYCFISHSKG